VVADGVVADGGGGREATGGALMLKIIDTVKEPDWIGATSIKADSGMPPLTVRFTVSGAGL
jgi:hypothetical protein